MSEEQARQRAQELTKKALAEAENETFKLQFPHLSRYISEYNNNFR